MQWKFNTDRELHALIKHHAKDLLDTAEGGVTGELTTDVQNNVIKLAERIIFLCKVIDYKRWPVNG
jgi:hypothetical protein